MLKPGKDIIILVDDNPVNLKIGKTALSEKYIVVTASSAENLFKLLEKEKPSLILMDVEMPDLNGYEAIKILKSKYDTKNIPVIFLTGKTDIEDELFGLSLGAVDYITKPFSPPRLLKHIEVHLQLEKQKEILKKQAEELNKYTDNLQIMVFEKIESVMQLQEAFLKTIAELVESRDNNTGGHIGRTKHGVRILIKEIQRKGLFREETKDCDMDLVLQSCQLHDMGKISVSDNILRKPEKLDDAEFDEMKKHTLYGEEIIEKIEALTKENSFLKYAKIFSASHHERWDGTGYPRQLKGSDIPLFGRIMAIADVYDALVSERPYKKALSHEEAVQIIAEGKGTQFDPVLVDVFLDAAEQFKESFL